MSKRPIRVVLLDEALEFIQSLPPKAREKVVYNYQKADTLVVATHGIIKKTQKTPQKEIAKAEEIRRQYFED